MITRPNCKINLGLHILGERSDGYHDIETLFYPCSVFTDELDIQPAEEFRVRIGANWREQDDLAVRAYRLLAASYHLPPVYIRLIKQIPVGAGLGGGSADGAFALMMLNDLFKLGLTMDQMAEYAARLGSDCPFFLYNQPMIGSGRCEILEPFDIDLSAYTLRIKVPRDVRISTAEAYRGVRPHEGMPLREALACPVTQWRECLENDFEKTVFAAHPQLAAVKQQLYDAGAVYASLSGSGSALYGLFPKEK